METIEYKGWKNSIRLSNSDTEVVVLTDVGPRVIHFSKIGGPNVFNVIPDAVGPKGAEDWKPIGGHRLWCAPEVLPRSYYPENVPVGSVRTSDLSVTVENPIESTTGVQKTLAVTLAAEGSAVRVEHTITNRNSWAITLAPWALSIVANGGKVVIPQEEFVAHANKLLPARPLVLWNFTDLGDSRWRWGSKYISLTQDDALAHPQKVGVYNTLKWAAHVTPTQAFIVRIVGDAVGPESLPDYGSNFETFTAGPFQELETLGPLKTLNPGESAVHVQHWFLAAESGIEDNDVDLDARLLPIVQQAESSTRSAFGE